MNIRLRFKSIPLCVVLFILGLSIPPYSLFADPTFSVAPGVFTLDLNRTRSAAIILTNTGDERIRLIVEPVYFPLDSRSLKAGEPLNKDFNNKDDLSDKIIVSPRIVSLSPGEKRYVRFSIRLKETLPPGDYRTHLLVKTQETKKTEMNTAAAQTQANTLSMRLSIKLETAIAVYGRMGLPKTNLKISCKKNAENQLVIEAINKSIWNYRGWVGIYQSPEQSADDPDTVLRLINIRESRKTLPTNQLFSPNFVLRWGLTKKQLVDGSHACTSPAVSTE